MNNLLQEKTKRVTYTELITFGHCLHLSSTQISFLSFHTSLQNSVMHFLMSLKVLLHFSDFCSSLTASLGRMPLYPISTSAFHLLTSIPVPSFFSFSQPNHSMFSISVLATSSDHIIAFMHSLTFNFNSPILCTFHGHFTKT